MAKKTPSLTGQQSKLSNRTKLSRECPLARARVVTAME
jgi:hypothetical protein